MVGPIPESPETLYTASVGLPEKPATAAEQACVDCAAQGDADPLTTIYTVHGTVLCLDHAVAERQKEYAK